MATSPENNLEPIPEKPTEFDLLQSAMESYSTIFPGDEQSDETGEQIAQIQNIRDQLRKKLIYLKPDLLQKNGNRQ